MPAQSLPEREEIAARLRALGFHETALAERLGLSKSALSRKLNGSRSLTYKEATTLLRIITTEEALRKSEGSAALSAQRMRRLRLRRALRLVAQGR